MPDTAILRSEEQATKARERALAKGRRTRQRNAKRKAREKERRKEQYLVWLTRERRAYAAYVASDRDPKLLSAWRKVWREEPTYDGPRDIESADVDQ